MNIRQFVECGRHGSSYPISKTEIPDIGKSPGPMDFRYNFKMQVVRSRGLFYEYSGFPDEVKRSEEVVRADDVTFLRR